MCLAGTAILPSSSVVSTSISVLRVSSESNSLGNVHQPFEQFCARDVEFHIVWFLII